jgi:DNA-binding transcriptional ArsR family regulator
MTNEAKLADKALSALADPTRRAIFERLSLAPAAVGVLARSLPVSRPAVSQHLRILREARLVHPSVCGTRRIYAVDRTGIIALCQWLEHLATDASAAPTRSDHGAEN